MELLRNSENENIIPPDCIYFDEFNCFDIANRFYFWVTSVFISDSVPAFPINYNNITIVPGDSNLPEEFSIPSPITPIEDVNQCDSHSASSVEDISKNIIKFSLKDISDDDSRYITREEFFKFMNSTTPSLNEPSSLPINQNSP